MPTDPTEVDPRRCPVCWTAFTPTRHNPRQRYCCPPCRVEDWRRRRDSAPTAPEPPSRLRDAFPEPVRETFICACCGRTVVTAVIGVFANLDVGSPTRFCSPACRTAAWRRRRAGVPERAPLQRRGGRSRSLTAPPNPKENPMNPP